MIETRRAQRTFGDGLIAEDVKDLHEEWMKHADRVLGDKEVVAAIYEALAERHPQSRTRGQPGSPAEVVLRLLVRTWQPRDRARPSTNPGAPWLFDSLAHRALALRRAGLRQFNCRRQSKAQGGDGAGCDGYGVFDPTRPPGADLHQRALLAVPSLFLAVRCAKCAMWEMVRPAVRDLDATLHLKRYRKRLVSSI
jgi:hypothetical protein